MPVDTDSLIEEVRDSEVAVRAFIEMARDLRRVRRVLDRGQIDIDMYGEDLGVTGITSPFKQFNGPYVIETILAVWDPTATTVTLQIGTDRTMSIGPTLGVFNPQGLKIQVARDDAVTLTVTPATKKSFLNIWGHADQRVVDEL
jgi:hypothetical protein